MMTRRVIELIGGVSLLLSLVSALVTGAFWLGGRNADFIALTERVKVLEAQKAESEKVQEALKEISTKTDSAIEQLVSVGVPPVQHMVLEPQWVREDDVFRILSDQVIVRVTKVSKFVLWADFKLTIPGEQSVVLAAVGLGERKSFRYDGAEYFLDVLHVREDKENGNEVEVSVVRNLTATPKK